MSSSGPLDWFYGPTVTDPDPGNMWHRNCGGRVLVIEEGFICLGCDDWQEHDPCACGSTCLCCCVCDRKE